MNCGIITTFNRRYVEIADITLPVMTRYAQKHGYGLHVGEYHEDPNRLETYGDRGKIALFEEQYPKYDAIMWLDVDVLVMNSDITIESRLQGMPFVWSYDVNGPCSGWWIARCIPQTHLFLSAVKTNAPNNGKLMTRAHQGSPHYVTLQLEPHGSSDQDEMRRLMNMPPYSTVACYCLPGKKVGHCYDYKELGWESFAYLGDYEEGDWLLTFPSSPLERRLELLKKHVQHIH